MVQRQEVCQEVGGPESHGVTLLGDSEKISSFPLPCPVLSGKPRVTFPEDSTKEFTTAWVTFLLEGFKGKVGNVQK